MPEANSQIYRSVKEKTDTTTTLHEYRKTMRPPGHVPYVVDNLWEWKRPKNYPCRRRSVFASPQASLAKELGSENGTVFRVEFKGEYNLCQVKKYKDSKFHPECNTLKKLLFDLLGKDWVNTELNEKEEFGRLWMPCLTRNQMNYLFGENEKLRKIRENLYNAIKYWEDVILIRKDMSLPYNDGELFFEAVNGYYLRALK